MMPGWVDRYVGAEFKECGRGPRYDCWGLLHAIYRDQFYIDLPSYAEQYRTTTDEQEIGALVRRERVVNWQQIPLAEARLGDVLVIRMRTQPMHCALVVEPPFFLHICRGFNAVLERWDSIVWRDRIETVHRYLAVHA